MAYAQRQAAKRAAMPSIPCGCGCGTPIPPITVLGKPATYAPGHNPSGESTRFQPGQAAWNKGEPAPWAIATHRGKTLTTTEIAQRTAKRRATDGYAAWNKGKSHPMRHQGQTGVSPKGIGGYRPDLDLYVRSRWEANYARYLHLIGRRFVYEPEVFVVTLPDGSAHAYRPDFLVDDAYYVEVKGWESADRPTKAILDAASAQLPRPLFMVRRAQYDALATEFSERIPQWEHRRAPFPEQPERTCKTCGADMRGKPRRQVYCGMRCRPAYWTGKKLPAEAIARRQESRYKGR